MFCQAAVAVAESFTLPSPVAVQATFLTFHCQGTKMAKVSPPKESLFSYESSFLVDVRGRRDRRATLARIETALEGKVGHRRRGRGDAQRQTWDIGQILHYGLS